MYQMRNDLFTSKREKHFCFCKEDYMFEKGGRHFCYCTIDRSNSHCIFRKILHEFTFQNMPCKIKSSLIFWDEV